MGKESSPGAAAVVDHRFTAFRELELRNFRGFVDTDGVVRLAPLTFLVGPNSSGKSSLIDALLLLMQGRLLSLQRPRPRWRGPMVDLGSFNDTVFGHETSSAIEIGVSIRIPSSELRSFETPRRPRPITPPVNVRARVLIRSASDSTFGRIVGIVLTDLDSGNSLRAEYAENESNEVVLTFGERTQTATLRDGLDGIYPIASALASLLQSDASANSLAFVTRSAASFKEGTPRQLARFVMEMFDSEFSDHAQRVASGRHGPQRWYELGSDEGSQQYGTEAVLRGVDPFSLTAPRSRSQRATSARGRSLAELLRDLDIAKGIFSFNLSDYHKSIQLVDSRTGIEANLIDVGYGASQVIPVLRGCMTRTTAPLFCEQPEIHLHPRAQGTVADLLVETSKQRQVLVETHSEHMINRARIAVASGAVPPEHVQILYVSRDERGSHVKQIPLLPDGEFAEPWPGGFFDERFEDTMRLLDLRARDSGRSADDPVGGSA